MNPFHFLVKFFKSLFPKKSPQFIFYQLPFEIKVHSHKVKITLAQRSDNIDHYLVIINGKIIGYYYLEVIKDEFDALRVGQELVSDLSKILEDNPNYYKDKLEYKQHVFFSGIENKYKFVHVNKE